MSPWYDDQAFTLACGFEDTDRSTRVKHRGLLIQSLLSKMTRMLGVLPSIVSGAIR